jgi:hypothetical protein
MLLKSNLKIFSNAIVARKNKALIINKFLTTGGNIENRLGE